MNYSNFENQFDSIKKYKTAEKTFLFSHINTSSLELIVLSYYVSYATNCLIGGHE